MILTDRDKSILRFIEDHGSLTINQCAKIFYKGNKQAYYQARKRIKKMADNNILKRYREDMKSETVYYFNRKLSIHDLKVIDVYAELISLGAEIKFFEQEYIISADGKEYRADALIECEYQGYFYPLLIEIDYTHFTTEKKLNSIYNSGYFQERYKDLDKNLFPTVMILRPFLPKTLIKSDSFNIYYLNFDLSDINSIFI